MLNVAVIGLGWWGKTIVRLLEGNEKLRVVRVVDVNPAAVEDFARHHRLETAPDFAAILDDPTVQGVVLCTPHSQHADQIVAAARAGKHVFCEKPLAMNRADVMRAVEAVEAAGVALAVGHERRFEPPIVELMRVVKSGEIGPPLQVEANFSQDKFLALDADNWRLSSAEAPAGPMTATGIHVLDLAIGVFGEVDHVCASVKRLGSRLANGDTLAILASFKSGGHALISAILATPFDGRFAVYCGAGWIEVRDKTHPEAPTGWTLTKVVRGGHREVVDYPATSGVIANLEAFADTAAGIRPYPVPRPEMIANIAALEAVIRSAATGTLVTVGVPS
jgi:predicted dehydrogenase